MKDDIERELTKQFFINKNKFIFMIEDPIKFFLTKEASCYSS
jgi:hypothetical protein